MDANQANSQLTPDKEKNGVDSAAQKVEPVSHFKRTLVPLDEYASRQGISSDIVEKQGQLGVIQVRKFKGKKFVVDVPAEQSADFDADEESAVAGAIITGSRPTTASKMLTVGLTIGFMVIVVSVFWLYMDSKTRLEDLNAEYTSLQNRFNDLAASNQNLKTAQDELADSKTEFARIQNRIAVSKTELEKIQNDLIKARRNLETIQSELTGIQGQLSLSKVEIESTQNGINETRNDLDRVYQQNAGPQGK